MIGVAIGTFGDRDHWAPLVERALQSVFHQTLKCDVKWIHHEDGDLHDARNSAARRLIKQGAEWLIFLDADDELEPHYVASMALASTFTDSSKYAVFYPSTRAVVDGVQDTQTHLHTAKNLLQQNFVNIGAMHSARMFQDIGGFDDWPVLEDWAYWTKAWVHGAEFFPCADAVYRAYIETKRPGRNKAAHPAVINETCSNIRSMYKFLAKQRGLVA